MQTNWVNMLVSVSSWPPRPENTGTLKRARIAPENGWLRKMKFPFGAFRPIFRGELAVSFREGILSEKHCYVPLVGRVF